MQRQRADRLLPRAKGHADPRADAGQLQQFGINLPCQDLRAAGLKQIRLAGPNHFRGTKRRIRDEWHLGQPLPQPVLDLRIGVHDGRAPHAPVFDKMQGAPVGKLGDEQPAHIVERRVGVENFREKGADLGDRRPAVRRFAFTAPSLHEPDDDGHHRHRDDETHQDDPPHGGRIISRDGRHQRGEFPR